MLNLDKKDWAIIIITLVLQIIIPELFQVLIEKLVNELKYWASLIIENSVRLIIIGLGSYILFREKN